MSYITFRLGKLYAAICRFTSKRHTETIGFHEGCSHILQTNGGTSEVRGEKRQFYVCKASRGRCLSWKKPKAFNSNQSFLSGFGLFENKSSLSDVDFEFPSSEDISFVGTMHGTTSITWQEPTKINPWVCSPLESATKKLEAKSLTNACQINYLRVVSFCWLFWAEFPGFTDPANFSHSVYIPPSSHHRKCFFLNMCVSNI